MKYLVQIEEDKESGGFVIWCPTLSGCISQGETKEEALENIKDAIRLYLDSMEELKRRENLLTVEVGV